ncbi:hypothetical protein N7466_010451 [Penicillium verhagenii]|uniref:uncharacterized protein n=1 Tax=Penicillium verhagenii TaxID=1562060 RepID=UPI002545B218|nr:uncharacterized protein N7466_010451 [Penicillium verhagenii]KAJ5918459.1 hypothetical protein N7466_010451 [Penicillium verhagenii]
MAIFDLMVFVEIWKVLKNGDRGHQGQGQGRQVNRVIRHGICFPLHDDSRGDVGPLMGGGFGMPSPAVFRLQAAFAFSLVLNSDSPASTTTDGHLEPVGLIGCIVPSASLEQHVPSTLVEPAAATGSTDEHAELTHEVVGSPLMWSTRYSNQ